MTTSPATFPDTVDCTVKTQHSLRTTFRATEMTTSPATFPATRTSASPVSFVLAPCVLSKSSAQSESISCAEAPPGGSPREPDRRARASPSSTQFSAGPTYSPRDPMQKIKSFLGQCQPCMAYFLPSFVELGFREDSFLDGILTWQMNDIILVLEKWRHAGKLTDLEVEALRIGLRQRQAAREQA
jgi:hypothetical protein